MSFNIAYAIDRDIIIIIIVHLNYPFDIIHAILFNRNMYVPTYL